MDELGIQGQRRPGGPGIFELEGAQGLGQKVLVSLSRSSDKRLRGRVQPGTEGFRMGEFDSLRRQEVDSPATNAALNSEEELGGH